MESGYSQRKRISLDSKKNTLNNISRPLITKTGCGAAERETYRERGREDEVFYEKGG